MKLKWVHELPEVDSLIEILFIICTYNMNFSQKLYPQSTILMNLNQINFVLCLFLHIFFWYLPSQVCLLMSFSVALLARKIISTFGYGIISQDDGMGKGVGRRVLPQFAFPSRKRLAE